MPSHLAHWILARRVAEELLTPRHARRLLARFGSFLALGAQGPDIFLHNHRRKPRGFHFGAVLHRKGNDAFIAQAALHLHPTGTRNGLISAEGAYLLGYVTHVYLDRAAHPYINYHAGWRGVPDMAPERPFMHSFLERLIDVQLAEFLGLGDARALEFAAAVDCGTLLPDSLMALLTSALRVSLIAAAEDPIVGARVQNAYQDSMAFYRFTDAPTMDYYREARRRELAGLTSARWLALVHPPAEMIGIDVLNRGGREWRHPCAPEVTSTASVPALFEAALSASLEAATLLVRVADKPRLRRVGRMETATALGELIGTANLNDGLVGDPPARRVVAAPLPLLELYRQMKAAFG